MKPEVVDNSNLLKAPYKIILYDASNKLGEWVSDYDVMEYLNFFIPVAIMLAKKRQDYGNHNLQLTGVQGCLVRLVDKLFRLLNLYGFDFVNSRFTDKVKQPNFESINDTVRDICGYSYLLYDLINSSINERL